MSAPLTAEEERWLVDEPFRVALGLAKAAHLPTFEIVTEVAEALAGALHAEREKVRRVIEIIEKEMAVPGDGGLWDEATTAAYVWVLEKLRAALAETEPQK